MKACPVISVITALLLSFAPLSAQTTFSLRGTVTDEERRPVCGCFVYTSESRGTVTDESGRYSMPISNPQNVEIHYECLGYFDVVLTFSPENTVPVSLDVKMQEDSTLPEEVIVDYYYKPEESPTIQPATLPSTIVFKETIHRSFFTVSTVDIPNEVEYITLYTQFGKANDLYPYVVRFGNKARASVQKKQEKRVFRAIKGQPVESIWFEGFVLETVGNMADDDAAQRASAVVHSQGLHDYGKRNTPVYYFRRVR